MSDDGGMPILVSKGGEATGHDYQTSTGMTAGKFAANSTSRYTVKAPVAAPREDAAVANLVVFIKFVQIQGDPTALSREIGRRGHQAPGPR